MTKTKNNAKPSFSELTATMKDVQTPVQKVVPVEYEEKIVNYSMQISEGLRDKLKMKSLLEKKSMRDLIVNALIETYPDLTK